jgi:hypothetical protein
MHSSVVSKVVFIVMALILLVSCEQGGSKVNTRQVRDSKSATANRSSKVASVSTTTTTKDNNLYNGITQFNVQ